MYPSGLSWLKNKSNDLSMFDFPSSLQPTNIVNSLDSMIASLIDLKFFIDIFLIMIVELGRVCVVFWGVFLTASQQVARVCLEWARRSLSVASFLSKTRSTIAADALSVSTRAARCFCWREGEGLLAMGILARAMYRPYCEMMALRHSPKGYGALLWISRCDYPVSSLLFCLDRAVAVDGGEDQGLLHMLLAFARPW